MSNQQYTAFYMTLDKNDKEMFIEAKNMPKKALEEHFPESKVASIAKRGWAGKLKLKKKLNKVKKLASIVKPKKSLMPKMSKKRQSTDKLKGETKRSKNSMDFDEVAKVESTKAQAADEPNQAQATA